ncbi:MAG: hypothetical protein M1815_002182 [Lichina confinis]|nr:MAG: hypothetical protein M1815_002182 [Lichina confinis]
MPPKRMTANPAKPARYRPGKPVAPEVSSDEDVDEEEEEEAEDVKPAEAPASIPPPNVTSFRPDATRMADSLKKVDLTERRRQAAAEETTRLRVQEAQRAQDEEGFVTEGSEEEEGSDEGSASESGEDDKSSEEEQPKRPLLRPTFIKKNKRQLPTALAQLDLEEARRRKEEDERKQAADETVQEQIRKDAEARAAGKKYWDDEEVGEEDEVDDRDGIDPDAELAAWKLRELKRIKRDREAIEQAEKEREEIERRRNLTTDEREAEDREYLARQKEEKEGKGKMGYMQKYFHRGAFFQDDAKAKGLDQRDIMGSRYQDDTNREILPEYMQIRDMARLGRKGRTRYRDLKTEDTGRWGQIGDDRRQGPGRGGKEFVSDDRFRPDRGGAGGGATGANASAMGERRRVDGAPEGPRALRAPPPGGGGDSETKMMEEPLHHGQHDPTTKDHPLRENIEHALEHGPGLDQDRAGDGRHRGDTDEEAAMTTTTTTTATMRTIKTIMAAIRTAPLDIETRETHVTGSQESEIETDTIAMTETVTGTEMDTITITVTVTETETVTGTGTKTATDPGTGTNPETAPNATALLGTTVAGQERGTKTKNMNKRGEGAEKARGGASKSAN